MKIRSICGLALLCGCFVAFASACGGGPQRIDLLRENAMANPTLSFTEPTGQASVQGDPDPLFGNASQTLHVTRFDYREEQLQQVEEELLAQASAAGFEMERVSPDGVLPSSAWEGRDSNGCF